jgi:hypothetical protein
MHRFLQHVLPSGFMKIRYYGFMSPGASIKIHEVRSLIEQANEVAIEKKPATSKIEDSASAPCCPDCAGILVFKCFVAPVRRESRIGYG